MRNQKKIVITQEEATFLINIIHSVQVPGNAVHAVGTLLGKLYKIVRKTEERITEQEV